MELHLCNRDKKKNNEWYISFDLCNSVNLTATSLLLSHERFLAFLQSGESIEKPSRVLIHYLQMIYQEKNANVNIEIQMMYVASHIMPFINLLTFTCNRTFDSSMGHANIAFITPPVQPARKTWLNQYFCFNSLFGVLLRRKQSIYMNYSWTAYK